MDTARATHRRDSGCLLLSWGFFISSWFLLYHLAGRSVQLRFIFSAASQSGSFSEVISSKETPVSSPKCAACPARRVTNMTLPPLEEHPHFRLLWPWTNVKQVHVPMYEPLEISVVSTQELPVNMTMDLNNAFVSVNIFFLVDNAGRPHSGC